MNVPENIVATIRNSSHEHVKYVNPFLTNVLWFAAAAQTVCQIIGPPSRAKMLASPNYDLLELTIERALSFWDIADGLKPRLAEIESALRSLIPKERRTTTRHAESLAPEGRNARTGSSNNIGFNHLMSWSHLDSSPVDPQLPLSETGAERTESDLASVNGMFPESNGTTALQLIFDDLEHFFPYGMDETFWTSQRFFP